MGLYIKEIQYNQLVSLISFATCDDKCDKCHWKNNGNYNFAEFDCLLKELRSILPDDRPVNVINKDEERTLNYLRRKEE
jgi:hypothetical protein